MLEQVLKKIKDYNELLAADDITIKNISYESIAKSPIYEILSELEKKETIKQRLKENIERMQDVCEELKFPCLY